MYSLTEVGMLQNEAYRRGYQDGLRDARLSPSERPVVMGNPPPIAEQVQAGTSKAKRKVSAYNRRYKAAFRRIAPKYKLKSGKWRTGGFKRAVKEAHRIAGGKKR